jgi:beta-phosphoglucomutase-like phosphatase (HAD superfamily)
VFKKRQLFRWLADNPQNPGGSAAGGGGAGGASTPPPAAPPPAAGASGDGAGEGDRKTYTQAELDKMFGDRAKQARKSAVSDLLTELGVQSTDDLKTALGALKAQADKDTTELQKAQKNIADLEKERDQLKGTLKTDRIRRLVERQASALKFNDPEDAYLRLKDKLELDDKGEEIPGLDDLLKQLAKDKPYLIGNGQQSPAPNINATQNGAAGKGELHINETEVRKKFGLRRRR